MRMPDRLDSAQELAILSFAIRLVLAQSDRQLLIASGVEALADFSQSERVALFLLSPCGESLTATGSIGTDMQAVPAPFTVAGTPFEGVIASKQPRRFALTDVHGLPCPTTDTGIAGRQCLCVPLVEAHNRVIGVATLDQPGATMLDDTTMQCLLILVLEMMYSELFTQISEQQTVQQSLAVLRKAGIVVHRVPEVDDIELIHDPTKFSQIVGNLLKNALRFRRERVDIRMDQNGNQLLVDVSDDGPGIKPENHALIFRRYAQIEAEGDLARKGHGLGLAGALILARRMGGHLTMQSEAGQGATFRLTLPIQAAITTATNGG